MPQSTARFTSVVAQAGRPVVHLAWLAVEKDAALKAALASHRVMTLHQTMRGGQKDFGTVGFAKGPQTQILIFPKSLRRFADQRVVGINYDLVADPGKLAPTKAAPHFPVSSAPLPAPKSAKPAASPELKLSPPKATPPAPRAPTVVVSFPLTWGAAAQELDEIRRQLKSRPEVSARLAALSERMKAKLAPH